MTKSGIGSHARAYRGATDDWLTPPEIINDLGPFDMDPCASREQPWRTATLQLTAGGLEVPWRGRIWLNPPYGPQTFKWLMKLADHGNGIALTFARTETKGFFEAVWGRADALLFIERRLHFHRPVTGERAAFNAGGPSVLVAYGENNVVKLKASFVNGALVADWKTI